MSKILAYLLMFCFAFDLLICSHAADCNLYGLALNKGESKTVPGKCSEVTCNGKGHEDYTLKACPNAYAPEKCKFVPVNLSKPYPECCPHWQC